MASASSKPSLWARMLHRQRPEKRGSKTPCRRFHRILCHSCFQEFASSEAAFVCRYAGHRSSGDSLSEAPAEHLFQADQDEPLSGQFLPEGKVLRLDQLVCPDDGRVCTERRCPHCRKPIPNYAGRFFETMIAFVGSPGSGKTTFALTLIESLLLRSADTLPGLAPMLDDQSSWDEFLALHRYWKVNGRPAKTEGLRDRPPINLSLISTDPANSDDARFFLVLSDGSGEITTSFENSHSARYYAMSSIVLLTINSEELLDRGVRWLDMPDHPASILNVIVKTIQSVRNISSETKCPQTLLVVLTKADMGLYEREPRLRPLPVPSGVLSSAEAADYLARKNQQIQESDAVCRSLLEKLNHTNFLNMAKMNFRRVRFFTSVAAGAGAPSDGVVDPVLWACRRL